MIARGSHGTPWLLRQVRAAPDGRPIPADPEVAERFGVVLEHARNTIAFQRNEERAMIEFRKHLGWYTKGLPDGGPLRRRLFQVERLEEVERIIAGYLDRVEAVAA